MEEAEAASRWCRMCPHAFYQLYYRGIITVRGERCRGRRLSKYSEAQYRLEKRERSTEVRHL